MERFEENKKLDSNEREADIKTKEKIKKTLRNAIIWGMVSIAGAFAVKGFKEEGAYENYKESVRNEEKNEYEELKREIINKIGEVKIKRMEVGDKEAFFNRKEKRLPPDIKNFEKAGFDSAVLRQIWSEDGKYPVGWINGEVSTIVFSNEDIEIPEDYGSELKGKKAGGMRMQGDLIIITISKEESKYLSKRDLADSLDFKMSHELAHSNDWETDNEINLLERAQLLSSILKRLQSEKPFKSLIEDFFGEKSYHQKINKDNPEEEIFLRAKEYWAEICQHYFNFPEWLQKEYPDDFVLVDQYVKKNDPNFNPQESKIKRQNILRENYGPSGGEFLDLDIKQKINR